MNVDVSSLRRKPEIIKNKIQKKASAYLALDDITIQIPDRYFETRLAVKGNNITSFGCFPIVSGKDYAILTSMSYIELSPTELYTTVIDDVNYHILGFSKGDVIIPNNAIVRNDEILYYIINEFLVNGNIPWFIEYEDLVKLFKTAKEHANASVDKNIAAFEIIISHLARDQKDKDTLYRHTSMKHDAYWIGLRSPEYALSDTTNRLIGAYMKQGIKTSLVKQSNSVEKIEELLRD